MTLAELSALQSETARYIDEQHGSLHMIAGNNNPRTGLQEVDAMLLQFSFALIRSIQLFSWFPKSELEFLSPRQKTIDGNAVFDRHLVLYQPRNGADAKTIRLTDNLQPPFTDDNVFVLIGRRHPKGLGPDARGVYLCWSDTRNTLEHMDFDKSMLVAGDILMTYLKWSQHAIVLNEGRDVQERFNRDISKLRAAWTRRNRKAVPPVQPDYWLTCQYP